ncbi:hypothetical protein M7784_03080 [Desulfovibrio aminophilus]|nr:hypothetical protein [Desulfovibrio aminophilus]MCM0754228.1 hypothetical protein [Desulfovibrio aminophilus]
MIHSEGPSPISPEEFDQQLQGLSQADNHRLMKIAAIYATQCDFSPDELLQEAVTRALEGRRHCPRDVRAVPFLAEVMRSIRADANKAAGRKPALVSLASLTEAGYDPPAPSATPEELWHSKHRFKDLWDEIRTIFHDDELAIDILEYVAAGYEGGEIQKDLRLDKTTYESKRKFIRRRIDRHFRQEPAHE